MSAADDELYIIQLEQVDVDFLQNDDQIIIKNLTVGLFREARKERESRRGKKSRLTLIQLKTICDVLTLGITGSERPEQS